MLWETRLQQPGVPRLKTWSQFLCTQNKPSFETRHFYSGSNDGVRITNAQQTNPTEFQFTSPLTRPIPFFMIKFLRRALKSFLGCNKEVIDLGSFYPCEAEAVAESWTNLRSRKGQLDLEKVYQWCLSSACSVKASSHRTAKPPRTVLLILYLVVFERRETFLAHVLRKELSWAHPGGLPSTARADRNYWSSQTLAQ